MLKYVKILLNVWNCRIFILKRFKAYSWPVVVSLPVFHTKVPQNAIKVPYLPFLSLLCVIVGYSNIHKKDNKKRLKIIGKIFADIKYLVYLCSAFGNSPNVGLKNIKLWKNFYCISSVSLGVFLCSFVHCFCGQTKIVISSGGWRWRWYQIFGVGYCL